MGPKTSRRAPLEDDYDDPPYRGSPARRGGAPSGGGDNKWVPQAEYDELSALCDNLLKQQEDMQIELAKSSTGKGRGGKAGPTVRGVGPNGARAKSQQQLHQEQLQGQVELRRAAEAELLAAREELRQARLAALEGTNE